MNLPDVFASVVATMPATLPPNSSLENINQTSSSSPRSPTLPPHSQVASVFIVLVVTVIILGTVVGNVLVVVAVFTSRALRAPQNLFLVSLACADILVATLVIPFSLANEVSTRLDICILFSQGTTHSVLIKVGNRLQFVRSGHVWRWRLRSDLSLMYIQTTKSLQLCEDVEIIGKRKKRLDKPKFWTNFDLRMGITKVYKDCERLYQVLWQTVHQLLRLFSQNFWSKDHQKRRKTF